MKWEAVFETLPVVLLVLETRRLLSNPDCSGNPAMGWMEGGAEL